MGSSTGCPGLVSPAPHAHAAAPLPFDAAAKGGEEFLKKERAGKQKEGEEFLKRGERAGKLKEGESFEQRKGVKGGKQRGREER